LIEAPRVQVEVIDMCRDLGSERRDEEKKRASDISFKLGRYCEERDGNLNEAIACFNDSL